MMAGSASDGQYKRRGSKRAVTPVAEESESTIDCKEGGAQRYSMEAHQLQQTRRRNLVSQQPFVCTKGSNKACRSNAEHQRRDKIATGE